MHSFLPSIGFTNIKNRQQLEPIYRQILESPDRKFISTISADTCLVQFSKDFGERFGISYFVYQTTPYDLSAIRPV